MCAGLGYCRAWQGIDGGCAMCTVVQESFSGDKRMTWTLQHILVPSALQAHARLDCGDFGSTMVEQMLFLPRSPGCCRTVSFAWK